MNGSMERTIQDLLARGDLIGAEKRIRKRIQEAPDSADSYYFMGVYHYLKGNIKETIDHLRRSLELDPNHTDASICLSVLLNDIGRYDEAKNLFEKANQSVAHRSTSNRTGIDRKFAVKHLELADLYFRYRRYDEAIEEYRKAALLDPLTLEIRIRLAKSYAKKGFVSRAIQELQQLKQENARFVPARIQLGLLHFSQGNILDAELEWEAVLDINPQNREAKSYLEMARQSR